MDNCKTDNYIPMNFFPGNKINDFKELFIIYYQIIN